MDGNQARRWAKDAAAGLFHYSGLRRALSSVRRAQAGGRRVVIAGYHRVVEDFDREAQTSIPGTLVSKATFRRHLEDAHAGGYELASLDEALLVLSGRRTARRDLLVITFDDGYRDVYRHAFPVLQALGIPATVYLATDFVGATRRFNHDRLFHLLRVAGQQAKRPGGSSLRAPAALEAVLRESGSTSEALDTFLGRYPASSVTQAIDALERELGPGPQQGPEAGDVMTWDEVRAMARAGISFGAHTMGHAVLTREPPERVEREIAGSKARIEAELGRRVDSFAYCNGWYSDDVIRALVRLGFRSAVTTEDLPNVLGGDPFTLKRKVLWENFSLSAAGSYSAPLTACHLDDVFGLLGLSHPVAGRQPPYASALATPLPPDAWDS